MFDTLKIIQTSTIFGNHMFNFLLTYILPITRQEKRYISHC